MTMADDGTGGPQVAFGISSDQEGKSRYRNDFALHIVRRRDDKTHLHVKPHYVVIFPASSPPFALRIAPVRSKARAPPTEPEKWFGDLSLRSWSSLDAFGPLCK